jgi:hypothetical protein
VLTCSNITLFCKMALLIYLYCVCNVYVMDTISFLYMVTTQACEFRAKTCSFLVLEMLHLNSFVTLLALSQLNVFRFAYCRSAVTEICNSTQLIPIVSLKNFSYFLNSWIQQWHTWFEKSIDTWGHGFVVLIRILIVVER